MYIWQWTGRQDYLSEQSCLSSSSGMPVILARRLNNSLMFISCASFIE